MIPTLKRAVGSWRSISKVLESMKNAERWTRSLTRKSLGIDKWIKGIAAIWRHISLVEELPFCAIVRQADDYDSWSSDLKLSKIVFYNGVLQWIASMVTGCMVNLLEGIKLSGNRNDQMACLLEHSLHEVRLVLHHLLPWFPLSSIWSNLSQMFLPEKQIAHKGALLCRISECEESNFNWPLPSWTL